MYVLVEDSHKSMQLCVLRIHTLLCGYVGENSYIIKQMCQDQNDVSFRWESCESKSKFVRSSLSDLAGSVGVGLNAVPVQVDGLRPHQVDDLRQKEVCGGWRWRRYKIVIISMNFYIFSKQSATRFYEDIYLQIGSQRPHVAMLQQVEVGQLLPL